MAGYHTTPASLHGEVHGQRSLVGTWGCKELDTTEPLTFTTFMMIHGCQGLGREKWTGVTQRASRAVKPLRVMMDMCHHTRLQAQRMYSTTV